jgi:cob(I)alamin adenosyltransferase
LQRESDRWYIRDVCFERLNQWSLSILQLNDIANAIYRLRASLSEGAYKGIEIYLRFKSGDIDRLEQMIEKMNERLEKSDYFDK